jgi:hypothetical protein
VIGGVIGGGEGDHFLANVADYASDPGAAGILTYHMPVSLLRMPVSLCLIFWNSKYLIVQESNTITITDTNCQLKILDVENLGPDTHY